MQDTNDLYAEFQVHPSSAPKVIEAAYKGLVRTYHPDVNKSPDANERMKRINLAYAVLRNPDKRHRERLRRGKEKPEIAVSDDI